VLIDSVLEVPKIDMFQKGDVELVLEAFY
jgi:hypothetical protein